jgi:hypothetical protein
LSDEDLLLALGIYRVDAVRYGIKTLAPKFYNGSQPDFVVSGPNVGGEIMNNPISAYSNIFIQLTWASLIYSLGQCESP